MTEFQAGSVNEINFPSKILERDIKLSIYLPKDYTALFKYKVVFCFDGKDFYSFGQIHRTYEKLRANNEVERAIFIGFNYESVDKRRAEFHPQGERTPLTVKAMAQEILPYIDQQFPTYKVGNGRLLLGDSLAASVALITALTYPRVFSQVGMLSPQHDDVITTLVQRCQFTDILTVWHTVGLEEADFALPTTGKRADFLTPNRALNQLLATQEMTYYYQEFDGGHRWKSWKPLLADTLTYFLSDNISF
ncbi:alpha/beta hydrolase-fold protein [Staphylococcus arlettae]|uniref:esterase family protein n=1 Tax=Staphylococcus arlettae TaxID=29378 RepID=UPI002DBF66F3|nr:alpha/beta hydrolase-fold protein [Staphylococcus arlettae]MEB7421886.1 alpha/beta hydrolase-fold protein [Staphylococcus arlettae]